MQRTQSLGDADFEARCYRQKISKGSSCAYKKWTFKHYNYSVFLPTCNSLKLDAFFRLFEQKKREWNVVQFFWKLEQRTK